MPQNIIVRDKDDGTLIPLQNVICSQIVEPTLREFRRATSGERASRLVETYMSLLTDALEDAQGRAVNDATRAGEGGDLEKRRKLQAEVGSLAEIRRLIETQYRRLAVGAK